MELTSDSACLYLRHAFAGMEKVLDRLDDETVNQKPPGWGTNSVAGLIVHCCELAPSWFAMPGLGRESHRDREAEFATTATVSELRARINAAAGQAMELAIEFDAGPTVPDHPFRDFMPGTDRSDGALVLHVLEELFQHLGHMEVTADAVERRA
ncbi:MAG: mycothiol transferase [Aquihabitans sp.]